MEDLVRIQRRLEVAAHEAGRDDVDVRALVFETARAAVAGVGDLHHGIAVPRHLAEHRRLRRNDTLELVPGGLPRRSGDVARRIRLDAYPVVRYARVVDVERVD